MNKEKSKAYYQKNRDKRIEYGIAYYYKNRDTINQKKRDNRRKLNPDWFNGHRNRLYINRSHRPKEINASNILERDLWWRYKLRLTDYTEMLTNQNGVCAICGKSETRTDKNNKTCRLHIDHDHEKDVVRGLLCNKCNRGLGFFKDNIDYLKNAIAYLEKSKNRTL